MEPRWHWWNCVASCALWSFNRQMIQLQFSTIKRRHLLTEFKVDKTPSKQKILILFKNRFNLLHCLTIFLAWLETKLCLCFNQWSQIIGFNGNGRRNLWSQEHLSSNWRLLGYWLRCLQDWVMILNRSLKLCVMSGVEHWNHNSKFQSISHSSHAAVRALKRAQGCFKYRPMCIEKSIEQCHNGKTISMIFSNWYHTSNTIFALRHTFSEFAYRNCLVVFLLAVLNSTTLATIIQLFSF